MAKSIGTAALEQARVAPLSVVEMLGLSLAPGVVITLLYALMAAFVVRMGAPTQLALLLAWMIGGIPLELGYLLYQGRKRNGRISLNGIVLFRQTLSRRQYGGLVLALLVWALVVSVALAPVSDSLRSSLFPWVPDWLLPSNLAGDLRRYSYPALLAILLLSAVLNVIGPLVEELYFRGYLLPRMSYLGWGAPLVNLLLFSLYHFWLPWENPLRIAALLPLVYVVWWKRNVTLGILVHCSLNSLGTLGLLVLVLMRS